ncbi:MAG: 3D domain-containing protein, partial [Pyrinomonadaceae bacterium]
TTGLVTTARAGMNKGSFSATAYCLQGRTASGTGVRRGIVAADPRVLRLGSKVMLTGGGYNGVYTVSDTGGGIKGRELDIWVPSCSEARRFGRRSVNVILLPN